jgi:hypothetical protein
MFRNASQPVFKFDILSIGGHHLRKIQNALQPRFRNLALFQHVTSMLS